MSHLFNSALLTLCFISVSACGSIEDPPSAEAPSRTVGMTSQEVGKADAGAWRLDLNGFNVSIEPRLVATHTRGRIYFKLRGTTSRDLETAQAREREGFVRSTSLKSPRSFEVALGRSGMEHVLSGQPLFVELRATDGESVTARVTVAPKFVATNPSRLYLHDTLVPVRYGDELRLRGRYQLPEGHELLQVFTDDDAEIVAEADGSGGTVDFTADAVILAADLPDDPVYFDAWDSAETHYRTQATMRVEIETFSLSSADTHDAWPRTECAEDVASCLSEAERGELDTERCGLAPEVDACAGFIVAPAAADPSRFVADLRGHIWSLYASEDPITQQKGAADVRTALERIDAAGVRYVGPDAHGMERWDPAHVDVWRHRDPISSGRAGHWYGAYDYGGNLLKIWRR